MKLHSYFLVLRNKFCTAFKNIKFHGISPLLLILLFDLKKREVLNTLRRPFSYTTDCMKLYETSSAGHILESRDPTVNCNTALLVTFRMPYFYVFNYALLNT